MMQDQTETSFNIGDKVIWDSSFGYDIGRFLGEGNQYYTYLVDMKTGIVQGHCSYPKSEIHKYSDELIAELNEKYKS